MTDYIPKQQVVFMLTNTMREMLPERLGANHGTHWSTVEDAMVRFSNRVVEKVEAYKPLTPPEREE
jgi:hypothetical protein